MTEQERLAIVDKINEETKILNQFSERKHILEQSEVVKEYLDVLEKIDFLDKKIKNIDLSEAINLEFSRGLKDAEREEKLSWCEHDIWMYYGSYETFYNDYCSCVEFFNIPNERDDNFSFNNYICLECGRVIRINDWKDFENNHIVLKSNHSKYNFDCFNDYLKYQKIYYELLYSYPVSEANDMIVEEFYKERGYSKKKVNK